MNWSSDGSICPGCGGAGRNSKRYPAALCRFCELELVDEGGKKAIIKGGIAEEGAAPWGTGLIIEVEGEKFPGNTPIYMKGTKCRAREAHLGGIVIQPVEVWRSK